MERAVSLPPCVAGQGVAGGFSLVGSAFQRHGEVVVGRYLHEESALAQFLQAEGLVLRHLPLLELEVGAARAITIDVGRVGRSLVEEVELHACGALVDADARQPPIAAFPSGHSGVGSRVALQEQTLIPGCRQTLHDVLADKILQVLRCLGDVYDATLEEGSQGEVMAQTPLRHDVASPCCEVARCEVHRADHIAGEEHVEVVLRGVQLWVPELLLAAIDAFLRHDVRIGAAQARRTCAAVEVDEHVILCCGLVEVLHSLHCLLRVVFPEIDLDALDAPALPSFQGSVHLIVREVLTGAQVGILPEQAIDAFRVRIVDEAREPRRAPACIDKVVRPAHVGSQFAVSPLAFAESAVSISDFTFATI